MRVIYEDADLKLVFSSHGGEDCFVTFTSWGKGHVNGFGQTFFDPRKVSGLYFISKWDHWWHTPGMETAVEQGKAWLLAEGFSRLIMYGASMGGYGAAYYAADFGAAFGILIAPQFEIRPDLPPHETRWASEAKLISFPQKDMRAALAQPTPFYVIYDPSSHDVAHVDLFSKLTSVTRINVPFGGHTPGIMLAQIGMLKDMVFDLVNGTFDVASFERSLRQKRRGSAVFWGALADQLGKKWPKLGMHAVGEATRLAPKDVVYVLRYIYLLLGQRRAEEALLNAQKAVELAPAHPAPWRALAKCRQAQGATEEAIAAAREAVKRRPKDADLQRVLLDSLITAKSFEEALEVAERALELDPNYKKTEELLHAVQRQLQSQGRHSLAS